MSNIKAFLRVVNQLRYILNDKQKRKSILCLVFSLISGIFETLGIAVIMPFLYALLAPETLRNNAYVSAAMKLLGVESNFGMIVMLGVFIVLVYFLKNVIVLLYNYVKIKTGTSIQKELSLEMLAAYFAKPYMYFLDVNTSEVLRGIGSDVDCTYAILDNIFIVLTAIVKIAFIGIYLVITDAVMALGLLLVAGILVFMVVGIFRPTLRKLGVEQREAITEQGKWGIQAVGGIKEIKVTNRSKQFIQKYDKAFTRRQKADLTYSFISVIPSPLLETLTIAGMMAVVVIRMGVNLDAETFIVTCASFALGAMRILPSVSIIIGGINSIVMNKPAMEEAYANLREARSQNVLIEDRNEESETALTMQDKIAIQNISWKYPHSEKYVLNELSLEINKGESVAFIGASGAGKTTLADIILGLLKPQLGKIELDGVDISTISNDWSTLVGYVPQMVYLLDDTIRNNILFGLEYEGDDKIWEALEQAQLKEFVEGLPQQLDTMVGERGIKFSGGQRQRVAIARALYYNPEILILDEATSALDAETETAVIESVEALQGKKTMVIIAHRLETIRKCDKIYAVENGQVHQKTYEEVFGKQVTKA